MFVCVFSTSENSLNGMREISQDANRLRHLILGLHRFECYIVSCEDTEHLPFSPHIRITATFLFHLSFPLSEMTQT